uniref:Nicotinic acetylcholine receptor beta 3 subunit n=1 Tax=Chilo suppressalis TaxID=168631 RepID=A0A0H4TQD1_CHISP|nr:nicotinic acetylcholine receptor beta 3 subunit [Chilo suppressalis]
MVWSTCLIILGIVHLTICKDCVIDNRPQYGQWEKQLHKDLSKCQEDFEAPTNNTIIKIRVVMKYFVVDDYEGSMTMESITLISWTDKRLIWNPKDYYGIAETYYRNYEYWLPPIMIINNAADRDDVFYHEFCNLKYNGEVMCMPKLKNKAPCISFTRNWPYDTNICNFDYGQAPFYEKKNLILVPKFNKTANIFGAEYGAEWIITDYRDYFNVTDKIKLRLTFTLKRSAEGLGAVMILPSTLLAVLTVVTLFRDVNNFKRFWFTCFSVLCHFYILLITNARVPKAGSGIPAILIFCRFSLLLTSVLVILSLGLKRLRNRTTIPPNWIGSVTSSVLDSRAKYLIWPRWKNKSNVLTFDSVNTKDIETWNNFCSILNCGLLKICSTAYVLMIILYVPRPPPLTF